uniref:Uncharacterized protein n=1 Tax=Peronospora matthiolae TaxID=2874970 RepID=A0AAV1TBL6_9STRA
MTWSQEGGAVGRTGSIASTKGKKDKRKNHETQLEEARGLEVLRKKRDPKIAGVLSLSSSVHMKKRKDIDHATTIPFEKKTPDGLCDVLEERRFASKMDEKCDDVKQQKADDGEVQCEQQYRKGFGTTTIEVKKTYVQRQVLSFWKHAPTDYQKEEAENEEDGNDLSMSSPRPMRSAAASSDADNDDFWLRKHDKTPKPYNFVIADDIELAKV